MKKLRILALLLCLVMALSLIGGCGSKPAAQEPAAEEPAAEEPAAEEPAAEEPAAEAPAAEEPAAEEPAVSTTDKTELVVGADYEPTDFNYYTNATDAQKIILAAIYETLFTYDGDEIVGSLAESYEYSGDDGLDLIIHLRDGITFTNGDPLTADDVLYTMQRNLENMAVASRFTSVDIANSTAIDDTTVCLRLFQYDNTLLPYLTGEYGAILDKEYVEADGDDAAIGQAPVGTGPYVLSSWDRGTSVTLTKNPEYWGDAANQPFDSILYKFFAEDSIRALELENGNLDIALLETGDSIDRISAAADKGLLVSSTPLTKEGWLCMSTIIEDTTFQDVNKRLAVAYALDMDAIVSTIAGSSAITATSLLPSGCQGYVNQAYEYNPELAKEYLEKAGCPDGFSFTMEVANNQQLNLELAEAMQAYLAQVGIDMKIESLDFFTQFGNMLAGKQLCSIMVGTANGDPAMCLSAYLKGSGACIAENHDEEFLRLLDLCRVEKDEATRAGYLADLQQYMHDNAYSIPVYEKVYSLGYQSYLTGVEDAGIKGELGFYVTRLSFNR